MKNIESFYPLSPMQEGMLFHSLEALHSGVYITQMYAELRGKLDMPAFRQSWQSALDRHPILRTSFAWEGLKRPVQVVERQVELPLEEQDWSGDREEESEARLHAFLAAERRQGFDLSAAPLLRLAIVRLGERRHRFIWTFHHLLLDAWSASLVLGEAVAGYESLRRSEIPSLPVRRPFRDYIVWLHRQKPQAAETFWRELLGDLESPTPLPFEPPGSPLPPGEPTFGQERVVLSAAQTVRLQGMARGNGLTVNTLLQGSWALLLSRYTGEPRVAFGFASSGRPVDLEGSDAMVGLFVNTLVLRIGVVPESLLRTWLEEVQKLQAAIRRFEYSALAQVQDWSRVPKGQPLFESAVNFENYRLEPPASSAGAAGSLEIQEIGGLEQSSIPLVVEVTPGRELALQIRYDRRRFAAHAVRRAVGHLGTIVHEFARGFDRRVGDVEMLSAAERHQILIGWNDTYVGEPEWPGCLHQVFAGWAARQPEAPALLFEGQAVSYAGLEAEANRLARYLRRMGIGPGSLVGLSLPRSPRMAVALLGILKAGAAFLPLDPSYPADRLAYMIEDSGIELVLTETASAALLPATDTASPLLLDAVRNGIEAEAPARPAVPTGPWDLAYVIYTSGSTGRPKGVLIAHLGLTNLVAAQLEAFGAAPGKRVLQFAPLSFDAAVFDVAMALGSGATLCLASQEALIPGPEFPALLRDLAVTHVTLPPSALAAMPESDLPDLEVIVCAGEALPGPLVERWGQGRQLFNAYGPTEATVWSTLSLCRPGDGSPKPGIGCPIRNVRTLVLDGALEPVAPGVEGELCVGGISLACGYLNRPSLTAERFVPDPWSGVAGARLYRTGDRARNRPDGNLDFLGRKDEQVKVRGFRIELGDVEAAVASHPAVQEAAAAVREDAAGNRSLVVFMVPRTQPAPGVSELRLHVQELLPAYMVPSVFSWVDGLAHTLSGKIDRRALPDLVSARPQLATGFAPAQTQVEQLLAEAWCEVLGLDRVGLHDNFFELGGDSILSIQIVSRVRSRIGVELPLQSLFENPTVAGLTARVNALLADQAPQLPTIEPVARGREIPLSFAQQRLWFLSLLEPDSPAYNESTTLRLQGALDVTAFLRSLEEITRRHEILRTTFPAAEGVPQQRIEPAARLPLLVADLSSLPPEAAEPELRRLAFATAQAAFDLENGPLLRVVLAALRPDDHAVLLCMHHIIGDAWSMRVLERELTALYESFSENRPSPLDPLPIQYADFAVWQRSWLQGELLEELLSFWRRHLGSDPLVLKLPTDRPRPEVQTFRGGQRGLQLGRDLQATVNALLRREGVTLFMFLVAVLETVLYRYAQQTRITVGTPVAGRNRQEVEPLIGCFVNTLVLCGDLEGDPALSDFLDRVRQESLAAFAHQDLPFEVLIEHLGVQRSLAVTPLFQVMFNLAPQTRLSLPGLQVASLDIEYGTAKFDLELQMAERADGLAGVLEYNADLFDATTAQRLVEHFRNLLTSALREPGRRLSELSLLSTPEHHQLEREWNDTLSDLPIDRCFHEIFTERARVRPDDLAAACGNRRLSYAQLERAANQLAHQLLLEGVGTDSVVALLAPRGLEFLVSVLAVFKAGGAYLPLDPEHPAPRVRRILAQSGAGLVLASSGLMSLVTQALTEPTPSPPVRLLELEEILRRPGRSDEPPPRALPESLAYVLFTSGSTGLPKGAMVTHRGMLNHLMAKVSTLRLTAADRIVQNASQCFDISVWQLLAALLAGGSTEIVSDEVAGDPWRLMEEVERRRVSVLEVVPSVLQVVVEEAERRRTLPGGGCLRWLVATGEALPPGVCERWLTAAPGIPLMNAYGPTECSDDVTHHIVTRAPGTAAARIPIGRPIDNTRLYVVDRAGQILPAGIAGELVIGGNGVGRGYLHDTPRTAAAFVPDPFSPEPGQRLYRSGDLCRRQPDGTLEFLGRIDHQVKLRGFRIELGEIEATLSGHPAVRETVVVADPQGGGRLVAYVAAAPTVSAGELRAYAREHLPEYMVPGDFVPLAALPRTPNGKVDRGALPAASSGGVGSRYQPPRDDLERQLVALWEELLPARAVGVDDDFFAAGGHSLLAVRLMSRIGQRFGRSLPLAALLRAPTIAELARVLRGDAGEPALSPLVAIRALPAPTLPPLFCVHPIGGGVLCYHELARHLPAQQPVYGLQAPELVQAAGQNVSIESMAMGYLAAMREVQPHGPYLLTGWSFGGVLAFEIARQARLLGEEVGVVALLDTWAPAIARRFTGADDATLLASLVRDHAVQNGKELWIDPQELRALPDDEMLEHVLARVRAAALVPADVDAQWIRRFLSGYRERSRALAAYEPEVSPGKLALLRASAVHSAGRELLDALHVDPEEPTRGWAGLAAEGIEIRVVPGSHETLLMEPNVATTAAALQRLIEESSTTGADFAELTAVTADEPFSVPVSLRDTKS